MKYTLTVLNNFLPFNIKSIEMQCNVPTSISLLNMLLSGSTILFPMSYTIVPHRAKNNQEALAF